MPIRLVLHCVWVGVCVCGCGWYGYLVIISPLGRFELRADDVLWESCVRCSGTHPGKSVHWLRGEGALAL